MFTDNTTAQNECANDASTQRATPWLDFIPWQEKNTRPSHYNIYYLQMM